MTETPEEKIARLETRLKRLKSNMLSSNTRPRIIAGAVTMDEARRNRDFAAGFLAALDRGQDRLVDRKSIADFVSEIEALWDLGNRPTLKPATVGHPANPTGQPGPAPAEIAASALPIPPWRA